MKCSTASTRFSARTLTTATPMTIPTRHIGRTSERRAISSPPFIIRCRWRRWRILRLRPSTRTTTSGFIQPSRARKAAQAANPATESRSRLRWRTTPSCTRGSRASPWPTPTATESATTMSALSPMSLTRCLATPTRPRCGSPRERFR